MRAACQAAGIDRKTAYNWRDRDNEFRRAWEEALEDACDILEAEAWQRARGKSDLLLIFLLKAHRPSKYRETSRHELTGVDGKPITVKDVENVRRQRWAQVAPILAAALKGENPPGDELE